MLTLYKFCWNPKSRKTLFIQSLWRHANSWPGKEIVLEFVQLMCF